MEPPKSICQELNIHLEKLREDPKFSWPTPKASFRESETCGCRYCHLACQSVAGSRQLNHEATAINARLTFDGRDGIGTKKDDILNAEFKDSGLLFSGRGSRNEVFVLDRADDPIIPVSTPISGYTGSDQTFNKVGEWFRTCFKEHTMLCPRVVEADIQCPLPYRVVDIGSQESPAVKLVETEGKFGHYACLSHCWGGEQTLRTTLFPDSLTQHKRGIEWTEIPKTFQDAIIVLRTFGFQYIWIDSLCIIQDSQEDWQVQSALMGEIYRNSIITIAGSASSGPQQGLFRTAQSAHLSQPFPANTSLEGIEKVQYREPLSHDASELPLLQRGWVFQERQLSPRYLHFGHNEVIWECMQRVVCECGTLSIQKHWRNNWLWPKNRLHPDTLRHLKDMPHVFRESWRTAIDEYSRMELSYPEDLFPAISGIAKAVKEAAGWEYVAGLWKETLITDLMWRTEKAQRAVRCKRWRAPSFSWASVMDDSTNDRKDKSYISYEYVRVFQRGLDESDLSARVDIYATVVETGCEAVGEDITGRLKSGFIVLRGTLVRATVRYTNAGHSDPTVRQWCISPLGKEPLWVARLCQDFDFNRPEYSIRDMGVVYCLKLIGMTKSRDTGNGEYLLYLVLRMVKADMLSGLSANGSYVFERIALLQDARGQDEVRLEDGSEESAIQRDVLVKIA